MIKSSKSLLNYSIWSYNTRLSDHLDMFITSLVKPKKKKKSLFFQHLGI